MSPHSIPLLLLLLTVGWGVGDYQPTWDSLDSRPLPSWYDEAKIGIFLHWGVFSVPSYGEKEAAFFWLYWNGQHADVVHFMDNNYRPNFTYQDFGPQFTAEFYDPVQWAQIFNASGARYVVFVSKHHEGFTNWPSKYSWNWNSFDVGPKRDLVGELAEGIRSTAPHIHFGLYHSLYEWYNPIYQQDKANHFTTNNFVTGKTLAELYELVNTYQPEVIWSDGDWEAQDWYWNSTVFLAWLFNESPVKDTVVVNDRWGIGCGCKHGSFYNCEDRYNPGVLQSHKWENAMTLDTGSWGYRRNAVTADYLSMHELLTTLAQTISCGGNLLVNVGPSHDGRIPVIMEERLRQLGSWLDINGEAVYASSPWTHQNDSLTAGVWYTTNLGFVYGMVLQWPKDNLLELGSVVATQDTQVTMLGYQAPTTTLQLQPLTKLGGGLVVEFPPMSDVASQWTWVIKMSNVTAA